MIFQPKKKPPEGGINTPEIDYSVKSFLILVSSADPAFHAHTPSRFNSAARNLIRAARGVIFNSPANARSVIMP
jgi:hypothetical protein